MRHGLLAALFTLLPALTPAAGFDAITCPDALVGMRSSIWRTSEIPVCWEEWQPEFARQRELVREAVQNTWETASAIRFVGWQQCASQEQGIRIHVADTGPHVKGVGTEARGMKDGMVLNFTFAKWGGPKCQNRPESLDYCIRVVAVHEFGHALSFTHEQNRSDAPECEFPPQGTSGDVFITPYDMDSVMNYCNKKWSGDGQLSPLDIKGLQAWYGVPGKTAARYDGVWETELHYSDPTCVSDRIRITVRDNQVTGLVKTPWGKEVTVTGSIDGESRLQGIDFNFSDKDRVQLKGRFPDGLVRSTDCGCGQYRFARVQ